MVMEPLERRNSTSVQLLLERFHYQKAGIVMNLKVLATVENFPDVMHLKASFSFNNGLLTVTECDLITTLDDGDPDSDVSVLIL